jgi:multidrug efflux pump subunit AcrA (membrane-fusion protein)
VSKRSLPRRPKAVTSRRRAVGSRSVDAPRRRPRGGLLARIIPAGVLAAAIAVVLVIAFGQLGGATSSARTEREVVSSADGVVQSTVTGTGSLEPVTEEDVGFQTSGTLHAVDVKEGEYVHKGQLLATLDSATAALTLKQARATLAEARTTLTDDRRTLVTEDDDSSSSDDTSAAVEDSGAVTEDVGDQVSTATPTATTTAATVTETVTAPAATVTTTTTAATGRGEPTPTATTHSEPTTTAARTTTAAQPTQTTATNSSTSGASSSGSSGGSGASSDVTAATIDSDQLAIVDDEQTVKEDVTDVDETRLTSPVSGTITTLESIVPGDSISSTGDTNESDSSSAETASTDSSADSDATGASSSASDSTAGSSSGSTASSSGTSSSSTFVDIDTLSHLSMSVSFTEADISKLKVGQAATVTLDALSDTELAGKVTAVSSLGTTDDDVVSYDATITLDQSDAQVKPGMSASAAVIIRQAHGVTVPSGAVTGTGTLASVTEDSDGKDTTKQVLVGLRGTSRDLIVSGLKSGVELVETETLPSTGSRTDDTSTSGASASSAIGGSSTRGGFGGRTAGGFGGGAAGGGGPP